MLNHLNITYLSKKRFLDYLKMIALLYKLTIMKIKTLHQCNCYQYYEYIFN